MGKRKVTILETAATAVAEIAFFIESEGMPATAQKFVDECFNFFEKLADDQVEHRNCTNQRWKNMNYRCTSFKKYVVAYLSLQKEIVICDFVSSKMLK